ncbi:hypothetical protein EDC04DRAFT_167621 [Pisolithus marmoratus]|nr:hypothetical protein EDC04DRAFT_167621 [Pisolithus marmoratus]
MDLAIQFILQLTPFANIHAMDDYADVLAYLVGYWEWDIDAYRTYLKYALVTTYIAVTSTLSMQPEHSHRQRIHSALCTGVSHHGRVLTLALQWIDSRGVAGAYQRYGSPYFSILAAIPRFGVVIIRNFEIVVIADSPALAFGLIVATMFPTLIFPLILSGMQKLNVWIADRRGPRRPLEHNGAEALTLVVRDRSGSKQVRVRLKYFMFTDIAPWLCRYSLSSTTLRSCPIVMGIFVHLRSRRHSSQ